MCDAVWDAPAVVFAHDENAAGFEHTAHFGEEGGEEGLGEVV